MPTDRYGYELSTSSSAAAGHWVDGADRFQPFGELVDASLRFAQLLRLSLVLLVGAPGLGQLRRHQAGQRMQQQGLCIALAQHPMQ